MKIVGGVQGGIRSLTGRVEMCHRVAGLVKFAAKRSGSRFLIGREGWKSGVVSRIMYGGGALVWMVEERNRLEKEQTAFGRWLWKAHPSVRNACIQAESGWSTFSEREAKAKMGYVRKIYVGGSMVAERKWRKKKWREKKKWRGKLKGTERTRRYAEERKDLRMEGYADGEDGARVRMMVRGDNLLVRANSNVAWRYDEEDRKCVCGEEETEKHVLFQCPLYERHRIEWNRVWKMEKGQEVLGFEVSSEMDWLILRSVGAIWREREKHERERE
ncbi:hypothetical protein CAPTEDRAFT_193859 [Capitella teleta]|uniref:Uncharacterized protein n=1 Tax=Capitella teleta TaxID=283909 RepID=R7V6R2_CAPTE|nr:hypothetical protein CAPTEDRAFT_193859 [Capitella teleta]|eukprot:ELU11455.1 hypothetical protein CAPTEDRAFT_193859 [Capitella teleta]